MRVCACWREQEGVPPRAFAHLNVLAGRDVDHAHLRAVGLDGVGVEAHEVGVDDPVGRAQAHHEAAGRALRAVQQADPLEARVHVRLLNLLPRELARTDLGGKVVDVGEGRGAILGELGLLDRVACLGLLDRGVRQVRGARAGLDCHLRITSAASL